MAGTPYVIKDGRFCYLKSVTVKGQTTTVTVPLCNFTAQCLEEIVKDDGLQEPVREFLVAGCLDIGQTLPIATIKASEFTGMAWVSKSWGMSANIEAGQSTKDKVRAAIQHLSKGAKQKTVYTHTGWRKINGVWAYLHGGGAIGAGRTVEVDLGKNLDLYRLSLPGGMESAHASLRFLDIGPWEVTAPLLSCVYLAPFSDICNIDFSLWLYGKSGSLKSTLAALALSHYGNFNRLKLPGSWLSTANSLEKLTFILKDCLTVIDDFTPASGTKEAQDMLQKAGRLIYQAGNRSGRGRLSQDLSARPDHYPRCLIVSTGEILLPGQRQSATARYIGIEFNPEKTKIDKSKLSASQKEQKLYSQAMAAYLEYVAPCLDDTLAEIRQLFEGYRNEYQSTAHLRVPEIQAWLSVGFQLFLKFQTHMGAITEGIARKMFDRAQNVFEVLGDKHSRIIEGDRPVLKFLSVLRELFYQGMIYVQSSTRAGEPPQSKKKLGWQGPHPAKNAELVGWADTDLIYLMPEMTMRVVNETIRKQGDYLPLGKNDLLATLAQEGVIEPGKRENTQTKWIQGSSKRVICLPLDKLFHDDALNDE
ncbi:MAG: DUF927 domain-containing protein [Candidatus Hadarchaeum sp.]